MKNWVERLVKCGIPEKEAQRVVDFFFKNRRTVEQLGNVGADVIVAVPCICRCSSVSIRNVSTQAIQVQNANIVFDFAGVRQ